jgi:hypothetical protein
MYWPRNSLLGLFPCYAACMVLLPDAGWRWDAMATNEAQVGVRVPNLY